MNYVSKFLSNFKEFYNEINSATLTGAIDVVIIKQEDGSYTCSPFHVRFGKIGVLRSREKIVDIEINGEPVDIHMKLGETGEAFFVEETQEHDDVPSHLATSPIPSFPDIEKELAKIHSSNSIEHPFDPGPQIVIASNNLASSENKDVFITVEDAEENTSLQGSIYHEVCETANTLQNETETNILSINSSEIPTDVVLEQSTIKEPINAVNVPTDYTGVVMEISTKTEGLNITDVPTDVGINVEESNQVSTLPAEESELSVVKLTSIKPTDDDSETTLDDITSINEDVQLQNSVNSLLPSQTSSFIPITNGMKSSLSLQKDEIPEVQNHLSDKAVITSNLSPDGCDDEQPVTTFEEDKSKVKKKRRKRSIIRKRKSRETQESSDEEEEIFQMDVDDDMDNQKRQIPYKPQLKSNIPNIKNMSSSLDRGMENVPITYFDSSFKSNFPSTSDGISHSWQYNSTLQLNFESHPFSDGDVTPILSPVSSRPPTPKSDTEYEILKHETASQTDAGENRWSWTWGELPVPPKSNAEVKREPPVTDDESQTKNLEADEDEQRSMLGGMFRFMRKTKKLRHQPETEGIYLDDLNLDELDPEIAKLYFPPRNSGFRIQSSAIVAPSRAKDEDVESGNGSSLPQSPQSVEGCMSSIHAIDSDNDEQQHMFDFKNYHDLALSLCGGLADYNGEIPHERFMHSLVTYDEFCENPNGVLNHPDSVIRLNNKYYNWQMVAPIVMANLLYQRPLSDKTVDKLTEDFMPKKPKKVETKSYSSWFYWRRSSAVENANKKADDKKKETEMKLEIPEGKQNDSEHETASPTKFYTDNQSRKNSEARKKGESAYTSMSSENEDTPIPSEEGPGNKQVKLLNKSLSLKGTEKFKKTLRLTSEQISKLNLQQGPNEVVFSVTTAFQGTTQCKCHIYLWNYDDKVVISDIDGTITKSDVLGHILPIIGKDWAQSGVAQLFTKIKNNGYQFLYLSSRAIGQAHVTREYLKSIRQNDLCLPEGPLLLNPSSLISAFHREVIEKKPEEFKISCLKDIQMLFPASTNPFYAGYGNRVNDVWAYRAVGIPMTRIFTINHKGELKHELTHSFQSTYTGLSSVVDHLFPPLKRTVATDGHLTTDFEGSEEFSSFTYWRSPFPDVSFEAVDIKKPSPNKKSTKGKQAT